MPRNLDPAVAAETQANDIRLAFFLEIAFKSETSYISTLPFNYVWNGQTWAGAGNLGSIGTISEGTDIQAYGTTVTLSGIDSSLLAEATGDIQLGAPATLYMAFFDEALNIIGSPFPVFSGQVDQPSIQASVDTVTITLNLESPMIRLQQGSFKRLTDADQRMLYPDDCSMQWVSLLSFQALRWGF